jgi:hypothetical protein
MPKLNAEGLPRPEKGNPPTIEISSVSEVLSAIQKIAEL